MLVPETLVFTQVLVILPWDQPLVRPTLFTTFPTSAVASAVILKSPTIVRERPGRFILAMRPMVNWENPLKYPAREGSLRRQTRPEGQPWLGQCFHAGARVPALQLAPVIVALADLELTRGETVRPEIGSQRLLGPGALGGVLDVHRGVPLGVEEEPSESGYCAGERGGILGRALTILYTWDPYNDPSIIKVDGQLR